MVPWSEVSSAERAARFRGWLRLGDRGTAAVEASMILAVVITLFFGTMQAGVYYYARSVALSAAQEGARVAAGEDASAADGIAAATVRAWSTDLLKGQSVSGARTGVEATVTVTGECVSLLPFLNPSITQSASRPVERVTG